MPDVATLDGVDAGNGSSGSYSISAGTNRCLVLFASKEVNPVTANTLTCTWGGRSMTRQDSDQSGTSGFGNQIAVFTLSEAEIALGSGSAISIGGAEGGEICWTCRSYENVDQASLASPDTNSQATSSASPNPTSANLTAADGAAIVAGSTMGNQSQAVTWHSDLTERTQQNNASSMISLAEGLFASGQSVTAAATWTGQNRAATMAIELLPAEDLVSNVGAAANHYLRAMGA